MMFVENNTIKLAHNCEVVGEFSTSNAITTVIVDPWFYGELDMHKLAVALDTGCVELKAHYARVRVKSAKWRKADVKLSDGRVGFILNDGTRRLEIPGRETRMVTYYPSWVNESIRFTDFDYALIRSRYPHSSERFMRTLKFCEERGYDDMLITDVGGWPAALFSLYTDWKGEQIAKLMYAGTSEIEPREILKEKYPFAIYCEGGSRFRTPEEKRMECGF